MLLIFLLAGIIRFWQLNAVPQHLTQDEVAVGWNAYSILKTGRDEWGASWPLQFRSVGDYKQPVLIYLTAISESIVGVNEWATRLPVAIFSALTLAVIYFWTKEIVTVKYRHWGPVWAVLLWTLSPWHIVFSRSGFEAVVALFFVSVLLLAWAKWIRSPLFTWIWLIIISSGLAVATYHSAKVYVPVINLGFLWLYRDRLRQFFGARSWRQPAFWASMAVFGLLAYFLLSRFYFGSALIRGQMTFLKNDFDYQRALLPAIESIRGFSLAKVFLLVGFWYKRLLDYLDPSWWLADGLGLALPNVPAQGVIYPLEFFFLLLGGAVWLSPKLLELVIDKKFKPGAMLGWLLFCGFLPATLANNAKHALRSLQALPVIYLLILLGGLATWHKLKTGRTKTLFLVLVLLGYVWGIVRLGDNYLIHYPIQLSETRHYPWAEAAKIVTQLAGDFDEVIVDPRFGTQGPYAVGVPHYYFLFYSQFDPQQYQLGADRDVGAIDYSKFKFRQINWQDELERHRHKLYVGSPWSFLLKTIPEDKIVWRQTFRNGVLGLMIVDGNY